ncbi:hypothetical protein NF681_06960 [Comamonadaceae bacterium OTU4NAUVB1]|nr:hypothetical protein NF681_06960 [Comamonadaceae bacterium OTU4NAUVB1]
METIHGDTPGASTPADLKQLATLRARFALLGHELRVVTKSDSMFYEVHRWGQSRHCSTIHDLEGFLAQLTGAKHGLRS